MTRVSSWSLINRILQHPDGILSCPAQPIMARCVLSLHCCSNFKGGTDRGLDCIWHDDMLNLLTHPESNLVSRWGWDRALKVASLCVCVCVWPYPCCVCEAQHHLQYKPINMMLWLPHPPPVTFLTRPSPLLLPGENTILPLPALNTPRHKLFCSVNCYGSFSSSWLDIKPLWPRNVNWSLNIRKLGQSSGRCSRRYLCVWDCRLFFPPPF